jgi:nitrate/TMAO reductase-like tetraheme cytochrome c subunit
MVERFTRRRSWPRIIGIGVAAFLVISAITVGSAEYYTSRPDFCGTCHIMDPYYESWAVDIHGKKLDTWCVECHYAPGQQHTLMAKFKGLSQLASYFSGRSGTSRPRAHVDDASCLRSGCHGDGEHLDKTLLIGEWRRETRSIASYETEIERRPTVGFVHAKHLEVTDRLAETDAAIEALTARLRSRVASDEYADLEKAARSVAPADVRQAELEGVVNRAATSDLRDDAFEWQRLVHMRLRLAQLANVNCAACHTFDASGGKHFVVDTQTCFVCHFTNQHFNRETGECLRCHEPPSRKIAIHSLPPVTPADSPASLMDHQDIIDRGIDCASCHLDVIQGDTSVTERDCTGCHDQSRYMEQFAARDVGTVEEYHRVHVAGQRAKCFDCHRTIRHELIDPQLVGTSAGFLQPVLSDCRHCHPNHHHEQVELLMGTGGHGVDRAMPNAMFGSRLNCRACHILQDTDVGGAPVIAATQDTCVACHGDDYRQLFDQWVGEIQSSVDELETSIARADAYFEARKSRGEAVSPDIVERLDRARANLAFVKSGNGIHNKNYALQLLANSQRDLDGILAGTASD